MNKHAGWFWKGARLTLVLCVVLLLAACGSQLRVGALRTESQSVELGDANAVGVEISMGAGELTVTGGAEKLLEADFTYNVAELKPEVAYTGGTVTVKQPDIEGRPALLDITGFRNEWDLRLHDGTPMDLKVDLGAGTSDLQLAGLSLTGLDIRQGAGKSSVDLSGNWERDLDGAIDVGAAEITVRLPRDVGVRVEVGTGVGTVNASGLTVDGNVYTNAAYGVSDVTLGLGIKAGVGRVNLEVE
jgi:N-terminal domain of toast_rack, DUF2154